MDERTFKLTHDIQNPDRDRRCKSGLRSVEVFKAGTIVRATLNQPIVETAPSYTTYSIQCERNRFDSVSFRESIHEEIAKQDPGVDMPIQTLEEAAAKVRSNISDFCRYVVRQLIKEGRLDPAETKELYEKTEEGDW